MPRFSRITVSCTTAVFFLALLTATMQSAYSADMLQDPNNAGTSGSSIANLRADLRIVYENQQRLYGKVQNLIGQLNNLQQRFKALENRIKVLENRQKKQKTHVSKELRKIRATLQKQRKARKDLVDKVARIVSEEVSEATGGLGENTSEDTATSIPIQGKYTVKRGDTLSAIGQAFNVSVERLKKVNDLKDDMIRVGEELRIPKPK